MCMRGIRPCRAGQPPIVRGISAVSGRGPRPGAADAPPRSSSMRTAPFPPTSRSVTLAFDLAEARRFAEPCMRSGPTSRVDSHCRGSAREFAARPAGQSVPPREHPFRWTIQPPTGSRAQRRPPSRGRLPPELAITAARSRLRSVGPTASRPRASRTPSRRVVAQGVARATHARAPVDGGASTGSAGRGVRQNGRPRTSPPPKCVSSRRQYAPSRWRCTQWSASVMTTHRPRG